MRILIIQVAFNPTEEHKNIHRKSILSILRAFYSTTNNHEVVYRILFNGKDSEVETHSNVVGAITNTENIGKNKLVNEWVKPLVDKYNPDYVWLLDNDVEFNDEDVFTRVTAICNSVIKLGYIGFQYAKGNHNIIRSGKADCFVTYRQGIMTKWDTVIVPEGGGGIAGSVIITSVGALREVNFKPYDDNTFFGNDDGRYLSIMIQKGYYTGMINSISVNHNYHSNSEWQGIKVRVAQNNNTMSYDEQKNLMNGYFKEE